MLPLLPGGAILWKPSEANIDMPPGTGAPWALGAGWLEASASGLTSFSAGGGEVGNFFPESFFLGVFFPEDFPEAEDFLSTALLFFSN